MTTTINTGGSVQKTKINCHVIRNTSSNSEKSLGLTSLTCVSFAKDILHLNTDKNLRDWTGEHNPRTRNKNHKAIERTLKTNPGMFPQYNGGLTVTCSSANVNVDKGEVTLIDASLINGAQTQGEINLYFKDLAELGEDLGGDIEVKLEILVNPDEQEVAEIAIARNSTTPVKKISQAGARKQLEELKQAMLDHNSNWVIETSESDRDLANANIDTVKLLQVTRLMTPDHIISPNSEISASEILRPYKSASSCLETFCTWQESKDSDPVLKLMYETTLSLAPKAWAEYEYWNAHPKWKGTGIQETYKTSKKRVCKKDSRGNVISCSHGLLFPVLSSMKNFAKQDTSGDWFIDKYERFRPEKLLKTAVRILHGDFEYDPMIMGRSISSYITLNGYPETLVDVIEGDI